MKSLVTAIAALVSLPLAAAGLHPTMLVAGAALPVATATTTPTTTAAPVAGVLFASVDDLAARWNENIEGWPMAQGRVSLLVPETFAVAFGAGPDGLDAFAVQPDSGLMVGGILDPSGAVTHLVVLASPTDENFLFDALVAQAVTVPEVAAEFRTALSEFVSARESGRRYVAGATHDVSLRCIPGSGTRLVQITISPVTDEATAFAAANDLLSAVVAASETDRWGRFSGL